MSDSLAAKVTQPRRASARRKFVILAASILALCILGLALGLGLGLGLKSHESSSTPSSSPTPTAGPGNNTTEETWWTPHSETSWQIQIAYPLNDTKLSVDVYDIDLFMNNASTVSLLHSLQRKVICYFSAGSYEDFRPDSSSFQASDYGKPLVGWDGEWWLDTNSTNVRDIMLDRLDRAQSIGCDGVDPDNVDGYDNDTGFDLSHEDAIEYLTFLANATHSRGMAIGLKNAGAIVPQVLDIMEWEVNEQCLEYQECAQFQPFIQAAKPVFHIEYPDIAPSISSATREEICSGADTEGFSSLLKKLSLDDWVETCA